jgi:hypothetical protein
MQSRDNLSVSDSFKFNASQLMMSTCNKGGDDLVPKTPRSMREATGGVTQTNVLLLISKGKEQPTVIPLFSDSSTKETPQICNNKESASSGSRREQ